MSTAVACAPRRAAVIASTPLPVQTSSTRAPGGSPSSSVGDAVRALARARADLAAAADGIALLAGAGAHPFAAPEGVLSDGARYEALLHEYGPVARRQLVFGLHVHVAVRPADRALA